MTHSQQLAREFRITTRQLAQRSDFFRTLLILLSHKNPTWCIYVDSNRKM
jgi:hypothetical protein